MMHCKRVSFWLSIAFLLCTTMTASAFGAAVVTELDQYAAGDTVVILGSSFLAGEDVQMQVARSDGSQCGDTWYVVADANTSFDTQWLQNCVSTPGEILEVQALGMTSGEFASTTFLVAPSRNLDQFQNGTTTAPENWANGNVNSSNSCYSEGAAVPYRYFISDMVAGDEHYFTIQMEWTKDSIHAFDYLIQYDYSEADAIDSAGGPCGNISTAAPGDCTDPTNLFALPDFADSANYSGTITADFFPAGFTFDSPLNLASYHATVDSVSPYSFGGSASDRTLEFTIYFSVTTTGSVGFYWGGHLASGTPSTWGLGYGSASVSGAPYHMRTINFDGGGGAGQDRSVQNGSICLPPELTITCAAGSLDCTNLSSSCSVLDSADSYDWTVIGGTIDSGQGTNEVFYTATDPDSIIISVATCNQASGCSDSYCCSGDTAVVYIDSNTPPAASCPGDSTVTFTCAVGEICVGPFSATDADGNLVSTSILPNGYGGSFDGTDYCFTPAGAGTYTIEFEAVDACGAADTCSVTVTVNLDNTAPVVSCPGDSSVFQCAPAEICVGPFSATDSENNIESTSFSFGTPSGSNVCFTPDTAGVYTIQYVATDSCGLADTCVTLVTVSYNQPPTIAFTGSDYSTFLCYPEEICLPYTVSDPDGATGLVETLVSGSGTIDTAANQVCFTPITAGDYTFIARVTDPCGESDEDTITVTVALNSLPTLTLPTPDPEFLCSATELCFTIVFGDPDAGTYESAPTATLISGTGTLTGDQVCFTPVDGVDSTYWFVIEVCDSCGSPGGAGEAVPPPSCVTDSFSVTVTFNQPPVASCPGDTSAAFTCEVGEICLGPFSCSDPDGNGSGSYIVPNGYGGSFDGTNYCFTPGGPGTYTIDFVCTDECGAEDTCSVTVDVTMDNSPPTVACPEDETHFQCEPETICVDGFTASDVDGNLESAIVSLGGSPLTLDGDSVCFLPDTAGVYDLYFEATDSCGLVASCHTYVTVVLNSPPTISLDPGGTINQCTEEEICVGYTASDPDAGQSWSVELLSGTGTLDEANSQVCFTPAGPGDYTITVRIVDSCGLADTASETYTVQLNTPPTIAFGDDIDTSLCESQEVCFPYTVNDPDGDAVIETLISGSGTIDTLNNQVCFTPAADGDYTFIVGVSDDPCGASDADTITVRVAINEPPTIAFDGNDTTISYCAPVEICLPYSVDDPDGLAGLIEELVSGPGTIDTAANEVCFTAPAAGDYTFIVRVTDPCGASDEDTITVTAEFNSPPTAQCPGSPIDTLICDPGTICIGGFGDSDPDGNIVERSTSIGSLNADSVCFFADTSGSYVIVYTVTDECGASDFCTVVVNVIIPQEPICPAVRDTSILACDYQEICLPLNTPSVGTNGFTCTVISGPGAIVGDQWCYTPTSLNDTLDVVVRCEDNCGHVCLDSFQVILYFELSCLDCPEFQLDTLSALSGSTVQACLRVVAPSFEWGGFDFLVNFDATVLTLNNVIPGEFLIDCNWEYFTYRLVSTNPGLVRVVGIADMNNSNKHPNCLAPDSGDVIACFVFQISPDRTLACLATPLRFWWNDCGDNTISNPAGDSLFIAGDDPFTVVDVEGNDLTGIPSLGGPPIPCPSDKYSTLPCMKFHNGKIRIICPNEIDDRGDLNLNGLAYEVADGVLYSNLLIYGTSVLDPNYFEAQIAASDINGDGSPVTLADLVYLIRVITGDIEPLPDGYTGTKIGAAVGTVELSTGRSAHQVTVNAASTTDMGGILLQFNTGGAEVLDVRAVGRAMNMDVKWNATDHGLRVLLANIGKERIAEGSGAILEIATSAPDRITLESAEAATYAGSELTANIAVPVVPDRFVLHQNYPNPFNPSTDFAIEVPVRSDYVLTIYNIAGQVVRNFTGTAEAGSLVLHWDGTDASGAKVASGVYLYRLQAGGFDAVRKMVLMK